MRFRTKVFVGFAALALTGLNAASLHAQQDDEKPKPAARVVLPLPDLRGDQQDSGQDNQNLEPDPHPVGGVQTATLGTPQLRHSYWAPAIQYGNTAQSNNFSNTGTQNAGWTTTNYASGNLSLLEAGSHVKFGTNYTGGGFFSTDSNQGNGQFHQLASAFEIDEKRWQLLFMEQFYYLPQSTFGFGGNTDLSVPGVSGPLSVTLPGIQEVFAPGQAVYTATGPRYSSDSAAQLSYAVSRRGSFTVAAVYGLLRFSDPGNTDNDMEILNAAYNYAITRKDFVGAIYRFTAYHFPGNPEALGDNVAQFMYGRRITGKLALTLAGGPDITNFRIPVNGVQRTLSGSGLASLVYSFRVSSARLNYSHGVASGGGLLSGSSSDQLTASLSRTLSRVWNASMNFGYARNKQLVTLKALSSPSYNSYLAGGGLTRPLGEAMSISIGYQAQIQASNGIVCTSACKTIETTHQIHLSFQWHGPAQVLR